MVLPQAVSAGLAGEKLSRAITGTADVSAGRSIVASVAGALFGATAIGGVTAGASALGATALAGAAIPAVAPVIIASGAVALIRSRWP